MIDAFWQHLRYAARSLWSAPGFTFTAVLTLALALGATSAIFSVFDTVVLRPLPYRNADRLQVIHEVVPAIAATRPRMPVNALHFREWRATARSFDDMALVGPTAHTLTGMGEPVRLGAARATPSLFRTLGVEPAFGRAFLEDEDVPGHDGVVILGHELWTARFGADVNVIGRAIMLDGAPATVVGVMPAGFSLPRFSHLYDIEIDVEQVQLWTPFAATPRDLRPLGGFNNVAIGRLKPGVTAAQAVEELDAIQSGLAQRAPEPARFAAALVPLADQIVRRSKTALQFVLGTVAMVLLVACANLTNLLLARSGRRRREFAIRRAAGAQRLQLVGQLLVESLLLAVISGVAGLAIAMGLIRWLQLYAPVDLPRIDEVALDWRALAFASGITVATGLLIGLLPAWRSTRVAPSELLRASVSTTDGPAGSRLRALLVGGQVAASLICLVAGALLANSFVNLMSIDRGFNAQNVVTVDLVLPPARVDAPERSIRFLQTLAERARTLPGVSAAGVTDRLPLSGVANSAIMIEGSNLPRQQRPTATIRSTDAGYFAAMRMTLRSGRMIDDRDTGRRVGVVSTLAASRLWPQQDPIGKRFRFGPDDSPYVEVVGVVADVRGVSLSVDPPANIYVPVSENFYSVAALAVRTTADPAVIAATLRTIIRDLDPQLAVPAIRTMDDIVDTSVAERRFQMTLVILLALASLVLAGLGIYGVVSQAVTQRTSEFGIRMALGANATRIRGLVVRQGLMPVLAGLAVGIVGSMGVSRFLQSLLFGVTPTDPVPLAAAALFLLSIATLASLVPAWRASRLDPMRALRVN